MSFWHVSGHRKPKNVFKIILDPSNFLNYQKSKRRRHYQTIGQLANNKQHPKYI
jgi:hypothetical protein